MTNLIVGTVAFDAIETPYGKTDKIVGGAATYISLAASFFTDKLNLVSVVGGDFPQSAIKMLHDHNVDTAGLQIKENEKTFFWSGRYHNNMNSRDTLETQLNVLETFDPIVPKEFSNSDFLMLGNLLPSVQQKVLDQMQERPKLIVLDTMNFCMDNALSELMKVIKRVDIIIINDEEALQLSKEDTLFAAANKILSFGPKQIVIKKGEHGAMLFDESRFFTVPAFPVKKVIDPTGAGDTFAGGFAGYLSQLDKINFEAMKLAVVHGTVMASFCVEGFGTSVMESLEKETTNNRLKEFKNFTRY